MDTITGVVKDRKVTVEVPADWPEGCEVVVKPARDDDGPMTPEEIAATLARMDARVTGWLSPEDDAAWCQALQEQREHEKARFAEHAAKLEAMWE